MIRLRSLLLIPFLLGARQDDDQKNTALLKTYPRLEELVGQADEFAKAGKYAAALEIYAEAIQSHPNFVVPVDRTRSIGVGQFVLDRIATWPKEGVEAYRRAYDPIALEAYERARRSGDAALLDDLVERHPMTTIVPDALILRADFALDAGDPNLAVAALQRALQHGPSRPVVVARLGLALSLAGRRAELQALLSRAQREWPEEKVTIPRDPRLLVAWLQDCLRDVKNRPSPSTAMEIPGWEMIGGSPTGSRIAEGGVTLGNSAWRYSIPLPQFESEEDERWRRPTSSPVEYRPVYPAVSDGIVYVHGEYVASALSLFGGSATPLWTFRLPQPTGVLMFDDRVIHATTVHEGRVFVNLITALGDSEDQLGYVRVKFPFPKRALFALDAFTGRLLWRAGGVHRAESLEENATFATPPTPEGDRLYVGVVKQRLSTDPFEHYLLCLDAATGKILWSTFVASGLTEINLFGNSTRESLGTPVVISGNTLLYGTNHGVFAAVEKKTGRLRWAARYEQLPVLPTRSIYVQKNSLQWINSPAVVSGNVAVYTPTDSRKMYGFDLATGRRVWSVERDSEMRVLYGEKDGMVILGGEELTFLDAANGQILRSVRLRNPGAGRGVIGEGVVYVPTRDGVATVRLDTKTESDYRRWSVTRPGGNIVVADGAIVRAGSDFVEAFVDRRNWDKAVDDALRRAPDDPMLCYRCGVRLVQSDRAAEAVPLLEKAYSRLEGSSRQEEERLARACRLRLFALRLDLGREALLKRATGEAKEHLTRAVKLAPDVGGRVEAALLLAETFVAAQGPERAIRELYALLDAPDEIVGGERLATVVRARVDAILDRHGPECFASIEREAERDLDRARREGTPEALIGITRRYPNSVSAETGLLEGAEAHARLGRGDEEIGALREFLREYPKSREIAVAHAKLVVALERRGQFGAAAPLLRRMARNFPNTPVLDGDRRVTAREFAEERLASEKYRRSGSGTTGGAPLRAPVTLVLNHTIKAPSVLPVPVGGVWPESAAGRTFVSAGGMVEALGKEGRAWSFRLDGTLRFAHFHEDALLLATESKIVRLHPMNGSVEWTYVSPAAMRGFALVGGQVCCFTGDPRHAASGIAGVDASRGTLSWLRTFDGYSNSSIHECGELAVFLATSPSRLYGIEAETGREVLAAPLVSAGLGLQMIQATDQHVIVGSANRYIEAYELPTGKLKWRADLRGMNTRVLETNSTSILLVSVKGESTTAALIDLKTGKYLRMADRVDLGDPRHAVLDEERALLVGYSPEKRETMVCELRLQDLAVTWTQNLGSPGAMLLPPQVSGGHLVVASFDRGDNQRFGYSVSVLDRTGKRVQNIQSECKYERPPAFAVSNGALVITVETLVQIFR